MKKIKDKIQEPETITIERNVITELHSIKRELKHKNLSVTISYLLYELNKKYEPMEIEE